MVTFGYVFDFPPAGLNRTLIFMQCPETCGVCPYKKLVQEVVQPSEPCLRQAASFSSDEGSIASLSEGAQSPRCSRQAVCPLEFCA